MPSKEAISDYIRHKDEDLEGVRWYPRVPPHAA